MSILHTINKSPFETNSLQSCIGYLRSGDAILLMEDAVYGAIAETEAGRSLAGIGEGISVFVLQPDLAARGIADTQLAPGLAMTDYNGFVDLVAEHDATQSWL